VVAAAEIPLPGSRVTDRKLFHTSN